MTNFYIGRNIRETINGYFLVISDKDLDLSRSRNYKESHHTTYAKAKAHMDHLINNGATWFNPHFDPTI